MIPPHIKEIYIYIYSNYIYLYFYPLTRQWKVLTLIKFPFTALLIFVVIYLILYIPIFFQFQFYPRIFISIILNSFLHVWPFFWDKFSSSRRNVCIIFSSARLLATKLHGFVSLKMYLLHLHSWRICFLEMEFQIQSYFLSAL